MHVSGVSRVRTARLSLLVSVWLIVGFIGAPAALAVSVASVGDLTVTEGDSGSTAAVFQVTLSESNGTTTVTYETYPITAVAGEDYSHTTGTLTFGPSETSKTVSVPVLGDILDEPNETFGLALTTIDNGTFQGGDPDGIATIVDNDDAPTIAIADAAITEGNSGTKIVTLPVSLSAPSGRTISVDFETADGSATFSGGDYHSASGRLVFAPGDTTETIGLTVVSDTVVEMDETFFVNLFAPVNATIADAQGAVTIVNDDSASDPPPSGTPSISISDAGVTEGNSGTVQTSLTVSLSASSADYITVDFTTTDGTATFADGDYFETSGRLVFEPGETSRSILVTVVGDTAVEDDETFFVDVSAPSNATIADSRGTVTIVNDDTTNPPPPPPPSGTFPQLSIGDATVLEGDDGETRVALVVSLSEASSSDVAVSFATADGTALFSDADFWQTNGRLVFAPGETSRTIVVTIVGDTRVESNEVFYVDLSDPSGATLGKSRSSVTITNDDSSTTPPPSGMPAISISDAIVEEGDGGSVLTTVWLTLSTASADPVSVSLTTVDGTATFEGADYWRTSGTLVFQPGDISRSLELTINGDAVAEGDEQFFVDLFDPVNATLDKERAIVTILDDEAPIATETTLRVVKRRYRTVARGHVVPPQPGERMRVVLRKKSDGRFRTITTRRPVLGEALDRDGDGVFESSYRATFRRQSRGRCLIKAVYLGNQSHGKSVARKRFRC